MHFPSSERILTYILRIKKKKTINLLCFKMFHLLGIWKLKILVAQVLKNVQKCFLNNRKENVQKFFNSRKENANTNKDVSIYLHITYLHTHINTNEINITYMNTYSFLERAIL